MKRLKETRIEKGITQKELAEKLGTTQSLVSKWELNKQEADYNTLCQIAQILNVSIDYLLGRTDELGNTYTEADSYTPEERRIIAMLRKLPPEMKHVAVGAIEAVSKIELQREEQADKAKKADGL